MLGNRRLRIAVGIFVVATVWNLLWTRATSYVSTEAVIDAPLISVHAPTDGVIISASPGFGSGVTADMTLLELRPRDSSPQDIMRLTGDLIAVQATIEALSVEIQETIEILSKLETRANAERRLEIGYLTQKLAETEEVRRQRAAEWDRASEELERLRKLSEAGGIAEVRLRDAELDLHLADARIAEADARVAATKTEIDAIERGLPSPAGTGRRDSSYDRIDDMHVHLNDLRTRHAIAVGEHRGLELRLQEEDAANGRLALFAPKAATSGVVWNASAPEGAYASRGGPLAEVLNCERRFVEVILSERVFERLEAGAEAKVMLKGAEEPFVAHIDFRRAEGAGTALSASSGVAPTSTTGTGVRLYLGLPPADVSDPSVAARFCDVGRTAEVLIPRPELGEQVAQVADWFVSLAARTRAVAGTLFATSAG